LQIGPSLQEQNNLIFQHFRCQTKLLNQTMLANNGVKIYYSQSYEEINSQSYGEMNVRKSRFKEKTNNLKSSLVHNFR